MKIELKLVEKGRSDRPLGALHPPFPQNKTASVILVGHKEIVEDVKKLIETYGKWDIC